MLLENQQLPKKYLWINWHVRVYVSCIIYVRILKLFAEDKQFKNY